MNAGEASHAATAFFENIDFENFEASHWRLVLKMRKHLNLSWCKKLWRNEMDKKIDFLKFLLMGQVGPLNGFESCEQIIDYFGEPDVFTPERKSYPTFMIYGDWSSVLGKIILM